MTCWAIIPVRASGEGKSRLAEVLGPEERQGLVSAMLAHVAEAAGRASNIAKTCIVGPSRHGLPETIPLLADPGLGLNSALRAALDEVGRAGITRAIIVAADLPQLTARELELLAAAAPGSIAIAPDRHVTGTNALSLPLPEAASFTFAFGADSYARHHVEAERLGLPIETIHSHGLAHDIDEPADLPDAEGLMKQPR